MSKNKKTTKRPDAKKVLAKPASTEGLNIKDPSPKVADKASNKKWDNMFNFAADEAKEKMQNFMNAGIGSLCGPSLNNHCEKSIANNMMTKLSANIRHNFEQNMELSQDALKCKTAVDVIEFQRKHFEINYKNTVKLLNDLFYDMQSATTESINIIQKKTSTT